MVKCVYVIVFLANFFINYPLSRWYCLLKIMFMKDLGLMYFTWTLWLTFDLYILNWYHRTNILPPFNPMIIWSVSKWNVKIEHTLYLGSLCVWLPFSMALYWASFTCNCRVSVWSTPLKCLKKSPTCLSVPPVSWMVCIKRPPTCPKVCAMWEKWKWSGRGDWLWTVSKRSHSLCPE